MSRPSTTLTYGIIALMIIMHTACNDLFGGKEIVNSDLTIVVKDTAYKPVNGAMVFTDPSTQTQYTDEGGCAFFGDIRTGEYLVQVELGDSLSDQKNINLTRQSQTLSFEIPLETTINLMVSHVDGISLENAVVTTIPTTSSYTLDENGRATLHIPVGKYSFVIIRGPGSVKTPSQLITYNDGNVQDIELTIDRQTPVISITNADNIVRHSIHDVTFTAECTDFEDGKLPTRSITWYSDIDGYLGYGENLFIGMMSGGSHTIILKAKDLDGLERQIATKIYLYSFIRDSYFPLKYQGTWTYTLSPETFEIVDKQQNVNTYLLTDYSASILANRIRKSTMMFMINNTVKYEYSVEDYFTCSHDTIFVTKTIEVLNTTYSEDSAIPQSSVRIVSEFDEKYPFMIDHIDVRKNKDIVFSTSAIVDWEISLVGAPTYNKREYYDFTSKIDFVDMTQYSYNDVRYDAAHMTITQNDITNNFILAKGLGIISSYNTIMNQDVHAILTNTNLNEFQDMEVHETNLKPSFASQTYSDTGEIPQEIRVLVDTLRRLSPRF